jgi:hypothetical protein
LILIEGLNHMVRLRERLPEPEREYHFAVGKMAQDLPRAPFPRCQAPLQAMRAKRRGQLRQASWCPRDHAARVAVAQILCIGIRSVGHKIIVLVTTAVVDERTDLRSSSG